MRVISGSARGTKLKSIESESTRPTLDRVKESLFNILQNDLEDKVILDLFAGSGALGIEALSRGAKKAIFCDKSKEDVKVLNENLEKTHLVDKAEVHTKDYASLLKIIKQKSLDLVFLDPPYKSNYAVEAIKIILLNNLLLESGKIVVETDEKCIIDEIRNISEVEIYDERKYGRVTLLMIRKTYRRKKYGNIYFTRNS